MDLTIPTTLEAKDILEHYNVNDLFRTIPNNYQISSVALNLYNKHCKPTQPVQLNLTEQHYNTLATLAQNVNAPIALVANFLIETVADCGKIQTKAISRALDCYYYALNNDKKIFSRILEGYSNSPFYNKEIGLSEEGVAKFLTISDERKEFN